MTSPRRARVDWAQIVGGLILAAVFVTAYVLALPWPVKTGLYPQLVSIAGAVFSLALVLVAVVRGRRGEPAAGLGDSESQAPAQHNDEDDPEDLEYVFHTAGRRAWLTALLWIALFVAGLVVLGLYLTTFGFTVLYLRLSAKASWVVTITYAVIATAVLVVGAGLLLHVPVPEGVIPLPL